MPATLQPYESLDDDSLDPLIGCFWDIRNVPLPEDKCIRAVVNRIRKFFEGHCEADFICVCNVHKHTPAVINELNLADVLLVHLEPTAVYTIQEKLRDYLWKFVELPRTPTTLVLLINDDYLVPDLTAFKRFHELRIVLLHGSNAPQTLLDCADECHNLEDLVKDMPLKNEEECRQHSTYT